MLEEVESPDLMPICLRHMVASYLVNWSDGQVSLLFLLENSQDISIHPHRKTDNFPKYAGPSARRQAAVTELGEINAYESKLCSVQATFIENETPFIFQPLTVNLNSRIAASLSFP